ncbi:hypothetical protein GCM10028808_48230 [Spirosoma migulaei]
MTQQEVALIAAMLALSGTMLTGLVTLTVSYFTALSNKKTQESLARLNTELQNQKGDVDARRDYEYEARKRLYKECEPLLLRLLEASENALYRIYSLVRTARNGDLEPGKDSWLQASGYYMASTIYNLLVPVVMFRLLQNKLTLVDLTVDATIRNQYLLAKWIYVLFTEPFDLAKQTPKLDYNPYDKDWPTKSIKQPKVYMIQGIPFGRLDAAVDSMIIQQDNASARCMTFGEFERLFEKDLKKKESVFRSFYDIFLNFHPASRPVLWRILIVKAHLYSKLMETFLQTKAYPFLADIPTNFSTNDLNKLDWRDSDSIPIEAILEPIQVAKTYLNH